MRTLIIATDATIQSPYNLVSNALIFAYPRRKPKVKIGCTVAGDLVE